MGLFDNFPHSNMHQLNLDWILRVCKKAEESTNNLDEKAKIVEASAKEARESAERAFRSAEIVSGYGLGMQYARNVTSLSEVTANGFYALSGEFLPNNSGWWGCAIFSSPNWASLTCISTEGCEIRFNLVEGVWTDYDWVNPPLKTGVEYRTVERYGGLPVYVKLIDFEELPNNFHKKKDFTDCPVKNVLSMDCICSKSGIYHNLLTLGNISRFSINRFSDKSEVQITTTADLSGYSAKILLKYVK